jgi:hypothetical protein
MDSLKGRNIGDMKKAETGLYVAMLACNILAVIMNFSLQGGVGATCLVYVADTASLTCESRSEYTRKYITSMVQVNSIPKWVNPSWRIPSITIEDATGNKTFVQEGVVPNYADDQYKPGGGHAIHEMVSKMEAADTGDMKFPITLKWTQIEGADLHHMLKCHLGLTLAVVIWTGLLSAASFRGHLFFQQFKVIGAIVLVWLSGSIHAAATAMSHPPTGASIAAIPEATMASLMQPCQPGPSAPSQMGMLMAVIAMQVPILVSMVPVGRSIANSHNAATGQKDSFELTV